MKREDFVQCLKLNVYGFGEWIDEPDYMEFTHDGIDCKILRNPELGNFCGYCKIPEGHQDFGKDYDDNPCDAYCGLTYSDQEEDGYWIGFDCAHAGDIVPGLEKSIEEARAAHDGELKECKELFPNVFKDYIFQSTYKNIDFVKAECIKIAKQIKERA